MKSTDKEKEIKELENRLNTLHNQMDELEEVSNTLSQKIILAKRQLELIYNMEP